MEDDLPVLAVPLGPDLADPMEIDRPPVVDAVEMTALEHDHHLAE